MIGTTGKVLFFVGLVLAAVGLLLLLADRRCLLRNMPERLPLGRLPGDVRFRGDGFSVYFSWVSCLVVSVAASLIAWLPGRLAGWLSRRRRFADARP
ncbi:DUF2905 domain-containing protein [Solidesulfovibrio sp.]